jgi:ferredoxin-NADP reductase
LQNNRIEFAAGFVEGGPGSLYLFDLTLGAEVKVSGPFGRLVLKEALPKRYVLVATSTGITPYRAMLPELRRRLQEYPDLQVMILLGVQTHTEILYEQEWMDFARQFPSQVTFRAQLSRMRDVELKLPFFHGYVQTSFEDIKLNPEEDVVYLCGNPGMIDVSFQDLKERGFDTQQVIREKYISNK